MMQWFSTLMAGIFILFLPIINECYPGFFHREVIYTYATLYIAVALLCLILNRKKTNWRISLLDVSIGIFILYMVGNLLINERRFADEAILYKWLAAILGYVWIRNLTHKKVLLYLLVLSGIEESITGILQYVGWIESEHLFFDITGHLGNPGPWGGYLAVCFAIACQLLKETFAKKRRLLCIGLSTSLALIGIGVVLSDSRAAWLGTILSILSITPFVRWSSTLGTKKVFVLTGLFVLLGISFYNYRPKSASSRLLIWNVCADMIFNQPITGHGIGAFQKEYMFYQAAYFQREDSCDELLLADNVAYAYNEWLHITIETGLAGLLLALFIAITVYKEKSTDRTTSAARIAFAVWLIFSFFSYPTDLFPLFIMCIILLGCMQFNRQLLSFKSNILPLATSILLFSICIQSLREGFFYQHASQEIATIFQKGHTSYNLFTNNDYSKLKNNETFNMTYIQSVVRHSSNPQDSVIANRIIPNSKTYIWLGDYYQRIGNYKKAEQIYLQASYMVPNRMMANYKLWRMYLERGQEKKAIEMAKKISCQPIKRINSFTVNAKEEVRLFLATP